MKFKGKKVRVVKLTDDKFNGEHPNGIYEGSERVGYPTEELEVGKRFYISTNTNWFMTSLVTEIVDDKTFKTENSTYSIEIVKLKQMKYTIKDLAEGRCSLKNDGTLEELQLILDTAFKDFNQDVTHYNDEDTIAYQACEQDRDRPIEWIFMDRGEEEYTLPMQSCSVFLKEISGWVNNKPDSKYNCPEKICCGDNSCKTTVSGVREFETGSRRDDDSNKPLVNHLDAYLRLRFGYLLRQGANKYDKGNWRKLQPTETALECLHRHLAKFELNLQNGVEQDEDHLSAVIFNVMLIMKNEEKEGIATDHYYGTLK